MHYILKLRSKSLTQKYNKTFFARQTSHVKYSSGIMACLARNVQTRGVGRFYERLRIINSISNSCDKGRAYPPPPPPPNFLDLYLPEFPNPLQFLVALISMRVIYANIVGKDWCSGFVFGHPLRPPHDELHFDTLWVRICVARMCQEICIVIHDITACNIL